MTGLGIRGRRPGWSGVGGSNASGLSRRRAGSQEHDVSPLFSDIRQEAICYFKKTGVYPPNHCTVVRESILKEHPWVALSLMEAFEESKRLAIERLNQSPTNLLVFGPHYLRGLDEAFGIDSFPYGIKANAKAIDMAQTYSVQQKLTELKQPLDEIFPKEAFYREEAL